MVCKIDVLLGKNHRFVQDEKSEDSPEVERDDKTFLDFVKGSLLKGSRRFVHVFFFPASAGEGRIQFNHDASAW